MVVHPAGPASDLPGVKASTRAIISLGTRLAATEMTPSAPTPAWAASGCRSPRDRQVGPEMISLA